MVKELADFTGQTFGYWTAIEAAGRDRARNRLWKVRCVCGKEKIIGGHHLRYGASKSCGCKRKAMLQKAVGGNNHYKWRGGLKTIGSLAWCQIRLGSLKEGARKYKTAPIVGNKYTVKRLWDEAKGQCKICCKPFVDKRKIHLDHDHTTGILRAFLCANCNVGIGMAGDSIDILHAMIKYLEVQNTKEPLKHWLRLMRSNRKRITRHRLEPVGPGGEIWR